MLLPPILANDVFYKMNIDTLDKKYPNVTDCISIDSQILEIQKDIDEIAKAKLRKHTNEFVLKKYIDEKLKKMDSHLKLLLKNKQNNFSLSDCRNKIEIKRVEETANIFSNVSATNETKLLTQTKLKQYVLIGVGSALLVASLVIILTNKK